MRCRPASAWRLGARIQKRSFDVYCACSATARCRRARSGRRRWPPSHHKARNLVAIVDPQTATSSTAKTDEVMGIEPLADKWRSFGWEVHEVDGPRRRGAQPPCCGGSRPTLVCARRRPASSPTPSRGKGRLVSWRASRAWHLGWLAAPRTRPAVLEEIMGGAAMSRPLSPPELAVPRQLNSRAPHPVDAVGHADRARRGRGHPVVRLPPPTCNIPTALIGFARRYPERPDPVRDFRAETW